MLEPDISDFPARDGIGNCMPRKRPEHPILSTTSPHLTLDSNIAREEYRGSRTLEHSPFLVGCAREKRTLNVTPSFGLQHAPSFTSMPDLDLTIATTSSISVHGSADQPVHTREQSEVIIQETPRYNHSRVAPKMRLLKPLNVDSTHKIENNRTSVDGAQKDNILVADPPEVIDLTISDEEADGQSVAKDITSSPSAHESEFLFTPPQSRERKRVFMDYVAVPPLPNKATKADYEPMSVLLRPTISVAHGAPHSPACDTFEATFDQNTTPFPSPGKGKGKEREHTPDPVSSPPSTPRKRIKCTPTHFGADSDATSNAIIDACYAQCTLPLQELETEPPLFRKNVATNTRFAFARRWNQLRQVLRRDEVDCVMRRHLYPEVKDCASSGSEVLTASPSVHRACQLVASSHRCNDTGRKKSEERSATSTSISKNSLSSDPHLPSVPLDAPQKPTQLSTIGSEVVDTDIDIDQYLNGLGDSPNKRPSPSRKNHAAFGHQHTQMMERLHDNEQVAGLRPFASDPVLISASVRSDSFLGMPLSPNVGDTSLPPTSTPFLMDDPTLDQDTSFSFHDDNSTTVWSLGNDDSLEHGAPGTAFPHDTVSGVGFGTIDPSLLGGGRVSQSPQRIPGERKSKSRSSLPEPVVYFGRQQDVRSLPWGRGGKKPVQIKFRGQASLASASGMAEETAGAVSSNLAQNNMALDEQDQVTQDRATNSAGASSEPSNYKSLKIRLSRTSITRVGSDTDTDSSYIPSASANSERRNRMKRPRELMEGAAGKTGTNFGTEERTSCHQCRNTTARLKMQCSRDIGRGRVCGKRFCQRCIDKRYPEITFDHTSRSFLCPVCTNTCNCSFCSRKRGEEFISMRTGAFINSRARPRVTLVSDETQVPHDVLSRNGNVSGTPGPPTETQNFWAHVYGLEGEHLGSAYWKETGSVSQLAHAPVALKEPKRPKIFIGHPQKSWKIRSVRDLEPMQDSVVAFIDSVQKPGRGSGKGKGKAVTPSLRLYIGNPTALHEPSERMPRSPTSSRSSSPGSDVDERVTSLPEVEEAAYWPQPDIGEWVSWEPPPLLDIERGMSLALSDEQVAKAIQVALAALS